MPIAPSRRFPAWLLYGFIALALVGAIAWATLGEIGRTAARDVTTDFGRYGLVTVRLTTDPYPPLPTGAVRLDATALDSAGRPVVLDSVTFDYGRKGETHRVGSQLAGAMTDGSGAFRGWIVFGEVGYWWVLVHLMKGGEQAEAEIQLYVEPAQ